MNTLDPSSAAFLDLLDQVDDLRHDLGKYIGFETRFVGLEADDETLRAALSSDIFKTRRRGSEVESAWELWARLRPTSLVDDPDIQLIEQTLQELREIDLAGPRPDLLRAAGLARTITLTTRRLASRIHALAEPD